MNKDIFCMAVEFTRQKLLFHKDEDWHDIQCFGLFSWSDVSKYLVGNPARIKSFKESLIETNMKKENRTIWCRPTEYFWKKYIMPLMSYLNNFSVEQQRKYFEDFNFIDRYEEYKKIIQ